MGKENYIVDRIEYLCEAKHMSRYTLSQKSGISQASISTMLNRKTIPTILTLEKICEGFGITLAQFFANDDSLPDLTAEQKEILEMWNSMDEQDKALVKSYMQGIMRK